MTRSAFTGAKIAILCNGKLLAYQRDQKPEIPFPGMWDLPGGGREHDEQPLECAIRETFEEFGFSVHPQSVVWERYYPGASPKSLGSYFFVANIATLGGRVTMRPDLFCEGQLWRSPAAFPHTMNDGRRCLPRRKHVFSTLSVLY